jgi:hypothetical protein
VVGTSHKSVPEMAIGMPGRWWTTDLSLSSPAALGAAGAVRAALSGRPTGLVAQRHSGGAAKGPCDIPYQRISTTVT